MCSVDIFAIPCHAVYSVQDMAHIQNLQVTQPTAQTSGPGNIGMGGGPRRPQMPGGAGLMA